MDQKTMKTHGFPDGRYPMILKLAWEPEKNEAADQILVNTFMKQVTSLRGEVSDIGVKSEVIDVL